MSLDTISIITFQHIVVSFSFGIVLFVGPVECCVKLLIINHQLTQCHFQLFVLFLVFPELLFEFLVYPVFTSFVIDFSF